MSTVTCRLGLGALRGKQGVVILSNYKHVVDTRVAYISSKVIRDMDPKPKPAPWPYKEKGYSNFHAFYDGTMKRFDENSVVITVEGPPAIGKSTFARQLAHDLDMLYFPMVTCDYQYINEYGIDFRDADPLLPPACRSIDEEKFLKDPKGMNAPVLGFQLQLLKFHQYLDALSHVFNTGQGVVIERCFWTDNAFMEANVKNGYNNKAELKNYNRRKEKVAKWIFRPHLGIYLDARPETVLNNFKKRGRGEEKVYHEKYLQDLEEFYKRKSLVEFEKYSELLVYDWNEPGDSEAVVEDIERMDWTKYEKHEDKIKSWRWLDDEEACKERWEVTNYKWKWLQRFWGTLTLDCPRLNHSGNDLDEYRKVKDGFVGTKYAVGYNPELGDKVLWKYDRNILCRLPDNVTQMLLDRIPAPK